MKAIYQRSLIFLSCQLFLTLPCYADFGLHMYLGDFNHSGAGKSVLTENATTAFNNPAGMSELSGFNIAFDAQYFVPSAAFTDTGSTDGISQPLNGGTGGDPGVDTLVPGMYYTLQLNEQWAIGGSVNVPFGLATKWDTGWIGRYQAIESSIQSVNINQGFSFRINEAWSLGAGLNLQRTDALLSNAIDFGAVCFSQLGPIACAGMGIPAPQSADGFVEIKGDDWGYGYNLGLHFHLPKTQIGVTYRSKIDHTLTGNADFTVPSQAAVFAPAFADTAAKLDLTTPEVFSVGASHQLSSTWAVMADLSFTRWSRIKAYQINFEDPNVTDLTIPRNWEDTWRVAFGVDYHHNTQWTWQGGVAYAQSAIPDATFDPIIPTSDAYWINLGANYAGSDTFNVSAGITYIIFKQRNINYTGNYGETVRGTIDPDLLVIGTTLNWLL